MWSEEINYKHLLFQIYHLYITYGLMSGLGLGMVMNCSISILDPYFSKHKRMACGLAMSGYGVGSFIFPPILNFLEDVYGWRGALLLLAGIAVHMIPISSLFRPFKNNSAQINQGILNEDASYCGKEKPCKNGSQLHRDEHIKLSYLKHELIRIISLFKIIPF